MRLRPLLITLWFATVFSQLSFYLYIFLVLNTTVTKFCVNEPNLWIWGFELVWFALALIGGLFVFDAYLRGVLKDG